MPQPVDPLRAFVALVLSVLLVVMVGWLLVIGKSLLLPIFIAVISVYVLVSASDRLGTLPVTRHFPEWARRIVVMAIFVLIIGALGLVMVGTVEQVMQRIPAYQDNLNALTQKVLGMFGITKAPNWQVIWDQISQRINLQRLAAFGLGSISSLLGVIFMVVVYASFLMGERGSFAHKVATAMPGERAVQTQSIVTDINRSIGDYLAVKTLVNAILGAISFAVMWALGVDFALFWAILIGLLNYIPYVGSMLGVVFPVVLTLAQFGDLQRTLIVAALLTSAQIWVGNVLEPRMVGRKVNMSPFVVMVALALWSSLWGISGAILAIPLTSIIAIVMAHFEHTRPIAILLAEDVSIFDRRDRPET